MITAKMNSVDTATMVPPLRAPLCAKPTMVHASPPWYATVDSDDKGTYVVFEKYDADGAIAQPANLTSCDLYCWEDYPRMWSKALNAGVPRSAIFAVELWSSQQRRQTANEG